MTLIIPDDATARHCIASFFNNHSAVEKIVELQGDKGYGVCARIAWQTLSHQSEVNRMTIEAVNNAARALIDVMGVNNPESAQHIKEIQDRERQLRLDDLNKQLLIQACRRLDIAL